MADDKKPKSEEKKKVKKPAAKPKTKVEKRTTPKKTTTKKSVTKKETVPKKKTTTKKPKAEKKIEKPNSETKPKKEEEKEEKEEKVEESEYKVKKKPELTKELKSKLQVRRQIKKRTPEFLREEWFRYKRIPKNWRRPDGISSKMRINLKYRPSKVRVGFRGPRKTRGLHSSGFEEIIVYNAGDLEGINPKTQAARIGSSVGTKKRMNIEKKAEELEIRVLNL
jgi:large subunit ribosomal protein L32e